MIEQIQVRYTSENNDTLEIEPRPEREAIILRTIQYGNMYSTLLSMQECRDLIKALCKAHNNIAEFPITFNDKTV